MLNYHRYGRGPTLVLQHGFLGGGGYFTPQMASLGEAFDMIAPDLPGFAGSQDAPAVDSIKALSDAQVTLLDQLGVDEFHLLGHSMGGMVALQTALDHPKRIKSLILYATNSCGDLPGRFETFEETANRVAVEGLENLAHRITATWFADGDNAPMFPFCLNAGRGAREDAVRGALNAFQTFDVTHRLAELNLPVLVIAGDRDRSYSLSGLVQMASSIAGARLQIIAGGAHCVHLEQADQFNLALAQFLRTTTPPAGS